MEFDRLESGSSGTNVAEQKYFTVAEANAMLPLVQRIVQDIVDQYQLAIDLGQQKQALGDDAQAEAIEQLEKKAQVAASKLNDLVEELSELGCELKDWETGLVDFPSQRDGDDVYLCWKLGEPEIGFWHDLHAGFSGRQTLELEEKS